MERPEIPLHGRVLEVRLRVALLRMNEIGEFGGITQEEDRGVVSYEIPDPFLGIELQRKPAWIPLRIRRAGLAADGGESEREGRLLSTLLEEPCLRVLRDVCSHRELTERAWA